MKDVVSHLPISVPLISSQNSASVDVRIGRASSSVRSKIEEDRDRFYEARNKEMEEFQVLSRRFEAATREEVQRLRDLVSKYGPKPLHP
jgi:hypothetical protein